MCVDGNVYVQCYGQFDEVLLMLLIDLRTRLKHQNIQHYSPLISAIVPIEKRCQSGQNVEEEWPQATKPKSQCFFCGLIL